MGFLDSWTEEFPKPELVQVAKTQLGKRISSGTRRKSYQDAFSVAADRAVPHSHSNIKDMMLDYGFHKLVRFDADRDCLVVEPIYLPPDKSPMRCLAINGKGSVYRGQVLRAQHLIHMILVCGDERTKPMMYSTRQLVFTAPMWAETPTHTIRGIMLRTSDPDAEPMASLVVLDRVVNQESPHLMCLKKEKGWSLRAYQVAEIKAGGYLGKMSENDAKFELYRNMLSEDVRGRPRFVKPLRVSE